jgi:hypothetical protein
MTDSKTLTLRVTVIGGERCANDYQVILIEACPSAASGGPATFPALRNGCGDERFPSASAYRSTKGHDASGDIGIVSLRDR